MPRTGSVSVRFDLPAAFLLKQMETIVILSIPPGNTCYVLALINSELRNMLLSHMLSEHKYYRQ